jgi:hypothetical protein
MAATSIMNSTDVVIQISEDGGTTYDIIGRATSASLSVSMETTRHHKQRFSRMARKS